MTRLIALVSLFILASVTFSFGQTATVKGKVLSFNENTNLPYATIVVEGFNIGSYTDEKGEFSFEIELSKFQDSITIIASFSSYKPIRRTVSTKEPLPYFNFTLKPNTFQEVQVVAYKNQDSLDVQRTQMSAVKIDMNDIKNLPAIGGEVDIIKAVQLLPGISSGVEGSVGMFVRGGNADQNLVLMDQAPIYEFGHLFGFYSVFNIDAVDQIEMIKGGFPSKYGGRLSSILDIKMRSADDNKIHARGGIGLLSSRLTLDAPIIKDKVFLTVSARRTYIDQVVQLADIDVPYYFYDLNAKIKAKITTKDNLYFSTYYGRDILSQPGRRGGPGGNFGFNKTNWVNSLRWQHVFNIKSTLNTFVYNTNFEYGVDGNFQSNGLSVNSSIKDYGIKTEYKRFLNKNNFWNTGVEVIHHDFNPNIINSKGQVTDFVKSGNGEALAFQEASIYGGLEYHMLNSLLTVKPGIRLSSAFVKNKTYWGLEPRISVKYSLSPESSVKLSYARMNQYLHRVSSSAVALPTDMWYPVTNDVVPQTSDQIAVGYERYVSPLKTIFTIEGYYKWMNNVIEYREGANLFLNNEFENELVQGKGKAYGMEFLAKRKGKKLSGWLAYTLSWSTRQFDELNNGEEFYARYDRRHDLSLTLNYSISKRTSFSAIWVYSTGSRFTPQTGNYVLPNSSNSGVQIIPIYGGRNSVALSPTHRLDLNVVIKSKPKFNGKWNGEWHIGAYNVYNQAQPNSIIIQEGPNGLQYTQPGLFGFLPSVSYNFKFN